ncbi:MAG: protein-tyrosine phosphatase [Candidatus Azotimanducaceae bacterium]|jgi:protein-tyrosine phosphatase
MKPSKAEPKTMIKDFAERHHSFEGCFNFRDIGGYPNKDGDTVRWHRYFRGGRQDRMTVADKVRLAKLGIRTQIDLRRPDEAGEQGRGPLTEMNTQYHNLAVIPEGGSDRLSQLVGDTAISGKRYLGYLEFGPAVWIQMFKIFAQEKDQPIYIHCTAGKDRTGVSTAFLLSVLGVDREIIEADYLLTNLDVVRQVDFLEKNVGLPDGVDRETMMHHAGVPETAMHDFLNGMNEKYGGPLAYLNSIGIDEATFAAVRRNFLEP